MKRAIGLTVALAFCLAGGSRVAQAASYNDVKSGNYNSTGTWGVATTPAGGAVADEVTVDSHKVTIGVAGDASNDMVYVTAGGTGAVVDVAAALADSTIILNGGVFSVGALAAATRVLGGDVRVAAASLWKINGGAGQTRSMMVSNLEFTAAGATLTITNDSTSGFGIGFIVGGTLAVSENGTIELLPQAGGRKASLTAGNLQFTQGRTLALLGTGDLNVNGSGSTQSGTIDWGSSGTLNANTANCLTNVTVVMTNGTLNADVGYSLSDATVVIGPGATVTTPGGATSNAWAGATLVMTGGVVQTGDIGNNNPNYGGRFQVAASSTFSGTPDFGTRTTTQSTLEFIQPDVTFTVHNATKTLGWGCTFQSVVLNESAALNLTMAEPRTAGKSLTVVAGNPAVRAGQTLTMLGTDHLTLSGALTLFFPGGADVVTDAVFRVVARTGTGVLTDNSTVGAPWTKTSDANRVSVNMNTPPATLRPGDGAAFQPYAAGYAQLDGQTSGTVYRVELDLAGASDLDAVLAQMSANGHFANLSIVSSSAQIIALDFVAEADGTSRFAWGGLPPGVAVEGVKLLLELHGAILIVK